VPNTVDSQYTTNKLVIFYFGDASFSNVLVNDAVNCCDYVASVTDESARSIVGMTRWHDGTKGLGEESVQCHCVHRTIHTNWSSIIICFSAGE